jgi:diacylglycerol kinase family enzyme
VLTLINRRSGAVLQAGAAKIEQRFRQAFEAAGLAADIRLLDGGEMAKAVRAADLRRFRCIAVAGGDGTVNAVLSAFQDNPAPLVILPLGTLNLFARDLGMSARLDADVAAIATAEFTAVDLGRVNGNVGQE